MHEDPLEAAARRPSPLGRLVGRIAFAMAGSAPLVPALTLAEGLAEAGLADVEPTAAERSAALDHSRAVADAFAQELQGELKAAIGARGVAGAVGVCRERAPAIAARLSKVSGARVTRKAERNRNPAGALDALEAAAWPAFAAAPTSASGKPRETLLVHTEGGRPHLRYLRAIPTAGTCLACHGDALGEDVRAALAGHYPEDLATGFAEGDLRGVFSIDWSLGALRAVMAMPLPAGGAGTP